MPQPSHETSLVYLDSQAEVDHFLASLSGTRELALDTEGASFHRFVDRIYLLQLSTREKSAIIDPLPIGSPTGLGRLLEDAHVEKVFHDADYDVLATALAAKRLAQHAEGLADSGSISEEKLEDAARFLRR